MAKTKTRTAKPRRDIASEVTDRIIASLEAGTVPWAKPWTAAGLLPTSIASGKPYRGINVWLLSLTALERGYSSPYWLTFRQAQERGGSVRKGEKGTLVVFWKLLDVDRKDEASGETTKAKIPLMRHFTVFNLEQTEGVKLPARFDLATDDAEPVAVDAAVTAVLEGYVDGPTVRYVRQDRAMYSPTDDVITLPELDQFKSSAGFASTAFHELSHSTGHASRLDRFDRSGAPQHFGSERYAKEELVAEMGAAMLGAIASVDVELDQSAAYVANWLEALSNDRSLVVSAAQLAQKAVDRILGTTFEKKEDA